MSAAELIECTGVLLCTEECTGLGTLMLPVLVRSAASALVSGLPWDSDWSMSGGGLIG